MNILYTNKKITNKQKNNKKSDGLFPNFHMDTLGLLLYCIDSDQNKNTIVISLNNIYIKPSPNVKCNVAL